MKYYKNAWYLNSTQNPIIKDNSLHSLTKTFIDLYSCMKPRKPGVRKVEKIDCTLLRKSAEIVSAKSWVNKDNMRLMLEKKGLLLCR